MKTCLTSLLVLFCGIAAASAQEAWDLFKAAERHYEAKDYPAALESLNQGLQANTNHLDTAAIAHYDIGTTRLQMGQYDEALKNLSEAGQSSDMETQRDALFNSGNALHAIAKIKEEAKDLPGAIEHLTRSLAHYENAIRLDRSSRDAKANYEISYNLREELIRKQQEQEQEQQKDEQKDEEQKDEQKDEEQKDEQKDEEQKDEQKDEEQKDEQKDEEQKDEEKPEPGEQPEPESSDPGEDEQQPPPESGPPDQPDPSESPGADPKEGRQMTPEEAKAMLDAMLAEEESNRDRARLILGKPQKVLKDW